MSSFAPVAALRQSSVLASAARLGTRRGEILIGGTPYEAACRIGSVKVELMDESSALVAQRQLTAWVSKQLLPELPLIGTRIVHEGQTWTLDETAGEDPSEVDWLLRCIAANR